MNIKPNKPNSVSTYWKERRDTPLRKGGWELWAQHLTSTEVDTLIGDGTTIAEAMEAARKYLKDNHPDRHL